VGWVVVHVPVRKCSAGSMQVNVRVLCPPVVGGCVNGSQGLCTDVWGASVSADELGEWVACKDWADNMSAVVNVAQLGNASVTHGGVNLTLEGATLHYVTANVTLLRPLTSFGVRVQATPVNGTDASEATVQVSLTHPEPVHVYVCMCSRLSRSLDLS
jgi:hypothetical protein